jgi:hypothetical protein
LIAQFAQPISITWRLRYVALTRLSAEVRDHLAAAVLGLLTGRIKRPPHRPKKASTEWQARQIAKRVISLKRHHGIEKLEAAVKQVAEENGCSVSKVWGALREHRFYSRMFWEKIEYDTEMEAANSAMEEAAVASLKEQHGDRAFTAAEVKAEVEELEERAFLEAGLWEDFEDYR